jgi:hypothetical protein
MGISDRDGDQGALRQHKCTSRLDRQWRLCRVAFWVIAASFASLLVANVLHRI